MSSHAGESTPLFVRFPAMARHVAHVPIGHWPTPILNADAFAHSLGLRSLHVKREDLSHPACGGNKTRGLEFLLGRAREVGAECLVTFSSAGSHHISKTAWHARRFDIDTVAAFVDQPASEYVRRNIATALACGATYIHANRLTVIPKTALAYWRETRKRRRSSRYAASDDRPVYFVAPGGTNRRSILGHVGAAFELKAQIDAGILPEPDYVYVVMGSLGTAVGLALGLKLACLKTRVVGVTVSYPWYATAGRLARFARRVHRWIRKLDPSVPDVQVQRSDFVVINSALGDGYALFTKRGESLARTMHATQGLRLDGTYTAKSLDGMMQYIERNGLHDARHLFWHTFFDFPPASPDLSTMPPALRPYFETPGQPWPIDFGSP